jgi:metal-sulfur cluster biosynthetic enzyme
MSWFGRKPAAPPPAAALGEAAAWEVLRQVVDPEIGVNIVDLGLIYRLAVTDARIAVTMTLTSPTCPMGDLLLDQVEEALRRLAPGVEVELDVAWEPPWSPDKMSPAAREQFGWEGD